MRPAAPRPASPGGGGAGGAGGAGAAAGAGAGGAGGQRVKVTLLEKQGAVDVEEGGSAGGGGAAVARQSAWLEALAGRGSGGAAGAAAEVRELCASARAGAKALSEHLTQEEVARIVLPCGGA